MNPRDVPTSTDPPRLTPVGATLLGATLAALSVAALAPLAEVGHVPGTDLPGHLALGRALVELGSGSALDAHFARGAVVAPNSLTYLLTATLLGAFDVATVGKILAALWLVGLPWALAAFLLAFRRPAELAPAGFVLAWQWPFLEGFIDYCLSIPLLLLALAALRSTIRRPSIPRAVATSLLAGLVFLAHVQGFLYLLLFAGVVLALATVDADSGQRLRTLAVGAAAALAVPAILAALWLLDGGGGLVREGVLADPASPPIALRAAGLHEATFFHFSARNPARALTWLALGVLGIGAIVRLLDSTPSADRDPTPADAVDRHAPALLFVILALLWAFGPLGFGRYFNFYNRVPAVALVFACAALAPIIPRPLGLARALLPVLLLPALVAFRAPVRDALRTWDDWNAGLHETLAMAPPGSTLVFLPEVPGDTGFRNPLWRHTAQLHTAHHGGTTSFSFANHPGRIIVQRDPTTDFEFARRADLHRLDILGRYDYLLHRGPTDLARDLPDHLTLVHRDGSWALWRLPGPAAKLDRNTVATFTRGGTGGAPISWNCPDGTAIGALDLVRRSDAMISWRVRCRPPPGMAPETDIGSLGPFFGAGGSSARIACRHGQVAIGMHGLADTLVRRVGLLCAPPDRLHDPRVVAATPDGSGAPIAAATDGSGAPIAAATDGSGAPIAAPQRRADFVHETAALGTSDGGEPFDLLCPPGTVAHGARGRAGSMIDAVGVACARWTDVVAAAEDRVRAREAAEGSGDPDDRARRDALERWRELQRAVEDSAPDGSEAP